MKSAFNVSWAERCFSSSAARLAVLLLTLMAAFPAQAVQLSVTTPGGGKGTVTSVRAGIDCGATCTFDFNASEVVSLTAKPDADNTFVGWGGDCSGSFYICNVTMDKAKTVTANFSSPGLLKVQTDGTGAGLVQSISSTDGLPIDGIDCGGADSTSVDCYEIMIPVPPDLFAILTLRATPEAGSTFEGWGGICSGKGLCVVSGGGTVIATFSGPTLYVKEAGSGTGVVTSVPTGINCPGICEKSYNRVTQNVPATDVLLTATPDIGSSFDATSGWSGCDSLVGTQCKVTMSTVKNVVATFTKTSYAYTLTVLSAGSGVGTVTSNPIGINCGTSCSHDYVSDALVALTAAAAANNTFIGWGGDCTGTGTCVVTMDQARNVTATFDSVATSAKKTLYLYKLGTGSGAVTSDPSGIDCPASGCSTTSASFDQNALVTLTATHAQGSTFSGWSGGGSGVAVNNVEIDGAAKTVTLTLASTVTAGQSVTVAYTDPTTGNDGNAIQDKFGNDTISVPVISVTNLTGATGDTTPPKFVQATANGNTLVMSYVDAASKLQDPSSLNPSSSISTAAFTVKVADVARTVTEVKVNGTSNTVTLTLDSVLVTDPITHDVTTETAVTEGKSVTVAYTAPASGAVIRDTALNPAATLVATNVTNLTGTQVDFLPPTFALATVNNNKLVLTYTGPYDLNENNLPVVGVFAVQVGGVNGCIGSATTCEVTMDTAKTVTATFDGVPPSFFTVHIGKMGAGTGTIKSSGVSQDPIDCDRNNKDCDGSFTLGTPVILKATADSDSKFTEWTGCTNTPSSTEDCYVLKTLKDVETDGTSYGVTATFTKASASVRTLTVTKLGTGTGLIKSSSTPSSPPVANQPEINCGGVCNVDFAIGVTVTLTATPGAPAFTGWRGACTGTLTTCTLSMDSGKSVIATFIPSVTASLAGTGRGVVTSQPEGINCGNSCTAIFASGSSAILTATPNTGSLFAGWAGPCTGTAAACTVGTSVTQSVTAMFSLANAAPAKPGAPLIAAAKPGPGSAAISFAPPASQGSSPVIRYDASCQATGLSSATASGTESPIVVRKLTPRRSYACTVSAVNSVGASSPSAALSVTPSSNSINSILQLLLH